MLALFARFLRFGLLAWGGPVAQIAMLRKELVDEERWIDGGRFNRLLAVFQVLPGPEATELAIHLGFLRGGRLGGLLAGLGFTLPGFVLMFALSWLYFQVDLTDDLVGAAMLGIQVVVVALVFRAVVGIGRHVLSDPRLWAVAVAAAVATVGNTPFWLVLASAAAAYLLSRRLWDGAAVALLVGVVVVGIVLLLFVWSTPPSSGLGTGGLPPAPATPGVGDRVPGGAAGPLELLVSGLKAGLLTFGGAYTAIPFVRADAVGSGWLSDAQFLDGLALGGILPAPLIIFSTFVGYVAGGPLGAVAMTIGVFLPAFSFSLVLGHRLETIVQHAALRHTLEGVAAGVVGIIAVTALDLGIGVARDAPSRDAAVAVFAGALLLLFALRSRAAVPIAIALGAVAGVVLFGGG